MLSALLLLLVSFTPIYARPATDLWKLPANDPTPPPESGPPGAVNADRDPAHLKFDILGIVGAYLIWILVTALLLFFLGHRLRRRNLAVTNGSLKLKMFKLQGKPGPKDLRLSPKDLREPVSSKVSSPKLSSIRSWGRKDKDPKATESVQSISSVGSAPKDSAHEAQNMEQLTDLYAQVMAQDERKIASQSRVISIPPPSPLDGEDEDHDSNPAEQEHLYHSNKLSHPLAPTPHDDHFDDDDVRYSRGGTRRTRKSKPLAIISELGSRAGAIISPKKTPKRISSREARVSHPMGSASLADDEYADNVPLSPRLYNPGPPPLTPAQRQAQQLIAPVLPEYDQDQPRPHTRERKAPPSLALRKEASNRASVGTKALPFRETYGDNSLASAPPTRTTFVERPDQMVSGPKTGALTGTIPQTPYSAYMPYTPMTPVTPGRLVGKAEMKRSKKEAKLRTLTEDDLVVPEEKGY